MQCYILLKAIKKCKFLSTLNKELIVNSNNNNNTHMNAPRKLSSTCPNVKQVHNEQ